MSYGKNIKRRREELGMTQEDLAKACGYQSKSSISKIESGDTDLTQSKLMEIAYALKTTPGALFESNNQDKTKQKKSFKDRIMTDVLGFPDPDDEENEDLFYDPYELYDSQELKYRFSNNLSFLLKNERMNNAKLAKAIGVSESAVGKWLSGSILPRSNMQLKLAEFFGIKRSELFEDPANRFEDRASQIERDWINAQIEKDKKAPYRVPLLGTIAAGAPILADEHVDEYIEISLDVKADFALRVQGDSMIDANIYDGDIVFIHQQPSVENGEIAAVMLIDPDTSDGIATLKRVYKTPNSLQLIPENRNYAPIIIDQSNGEGAKILGKATYYLTQAR